MMTDSYHSGKQQRAHRKEKQRAELVAQFAQRRAELIFWQDRRGLRDLRNEAAQHNIVYIFAKDGDLTDD